MTATASRVLIDEVSDDIVLPYTVGALSVRGRVVRLGPALDAIFARHAYPDAVNRTLGEAAALAVLLGSMLKGEGRFQLQTKSDGPLGMIVVDFDAPSRLRLLARFDRRRLAGAIERREREILGRGHLAFTFDPGGDRSRYQGVTPVEGGGLERAAHDYFARSEQIPTHVRLAVGRNVTARGAQWRAGGILAQFLPSSSDRLRRADLDPGDAPPGAAPAPKVDEDDAWIEAKSHIATVEDHELIDPRLSSERLLYRLFSERGVRVAEPRTLYDVCRCSAARMDAMLRSFTAEERRAMVGDDGLIGVTCEFCSTKRVFDPTEFEVEGGDASAA